MSDGHKTILVSGSLVFNGHCSQGLLTNDHWSVTMVNLQLNIISSENATKRVLLLNQENFLTLWSELRYPCSDGHKTIPWSQPQQTNQANNQLNMQLLV